MLYTKDGLTLSTAEGNDTAIALFHSTDPSKLTMRAHGESTESVAGQLRCFHLQNKVALAERYIPPLVPLHSVVVLSLLKTDDVIRELDTDRLLKTLAHSEANHQTIMLSNIPATYILQHPAITGWLKLVNTIHW